MREGFENALGGRVEDDDAGGAIVIEVELVVVGEAGAVEAWSGLQVGRGGRRDEVWKDWGRGTGTVLFN